LNIAQAKDQIESAMKAYFTKDEFGAYRIPIEKQRPVFMIGPPGIGKTAIMEQIAAELGVGLVSYSMTHHTRQSALGLPYITEKEYGGRSYQVTEYTMSEIIGSIYDLMRETGLTEGILFLDEINCVSETLAPCMLQFLQYKVFGQHRVPPGWILVTAGNPPEYNKSVRDFDTVTWDRLKRIDVEPDYETWKEYAYKKGVHASVMTYLAARKKDFYKVENTAEGKRFATARGWDDLSEMIKLYEENGLRVDELLIGQYIQDPRTARDFAVYYDLYNKYRSDYEVEKIVDGTVSESIVLRAQRAPMDERLSLLGLLFDCVTSKLKAVCESENVLELAATQLRAVKSQLSAGKSVAELIEEQIALQTEKLQSGQRACSLSPQSQREIRRMLLMLEGFRTGLIAVLEPDFAVLRSEFGAELQKLREAAAEGSRGLDNAFAFCERAFSDGDEVLIFVTELTASYYSARFIGHYGCDRYYFHNKELRFEERQQEIVRRIDELDLSV
jgi:MoxR-like ATPase